MPRRSIELLAPTGRVLSRRNKAVWSLLRSVTPRPLFKLFAAYDDAWWLASNVEKGRTVTDLPIRQTYYWPNPDGSPRTKGPALLMASYDDGNSIGFWDAFRPKRGAGRLTAKERAARAYEPYVGEETPGETTPEWDAHHAPRVMVEEIQRQLQAIHGLLYVPKPYSAAFMDWGDDPWGGGWNSWNIGVKSWEVAKAVQQPVPELPVYIVGEAYSRDQGWVEGALDTSDQVLATHFGVPPIA
jgi:monoamine oxidase